MSMSVSSVSTPPVRTSEAAEGPGPDRTPDGDSDDGAKAAATTQKPPAAAGTGKVVDTYA